MTDAKWNPGAFVWRELMCPDVEKAKGFYGELCGWSFKDVNMGDFVYTMAMVGEKSVGGLMPMAPESGHPPHWMSYVSVNDVDASAERAKQHGGTVAVAPQDIPNIGRFSVIGDPGGAYFSLFRGAQGDPPAGERPGLGTFCWETLTTKNMDESKKFYAEVVGWTLGSAPMGPSGVPVFSMGEAAYADVQEAKGNMPPAWFTYVVVENREKSNERVGKLGGKVVEPKIDVENVGKISLIADPAGAFIGLFQPAM